MIVRIVIDNESYRAISCRDVSIEHAIGRPGFARVGIFYSWDHSLMPSRSFTVDMSYTKIHILNDLGEEIGDAQPLLDQIRDSHKEANGDPE